MRRRLVSVLLALVLVPLVAGQALALGTLDQEVLPGYTSVSVGSGAIWQTFTAGKTGLLDTVALYGFTGNGSTWNVNVQATSGGAPSGPSLATGSAAASGSLGWTDITLSPAIAVSSGTMYAIIVSAPTPFWTDAAAPYAGGSGSILADFAFRTYVTPLAVTLGSISPTEGTVVNSDVATFTADTSLTASDFTATIDWGDGTQTAGVVTGSAGSFAVSASGAPHTYSDEGSFIATVAVNETGVGTATASGTVTVAEADAFTPQLAPIITEPEGDVFTGPVAVFTSTLASNSVADFTATIDWGDGTQTAPYSITDAGPTIGGENILVVGTHTYADEGSYPVSVTLSDDSPGTATATATATATVFEHDVLSGSLAAITPAYQTPFGGTVATFSDTNTNNVAGDFTATIAWGDGTTNPGTVSGGAGSFAVSGTHTYATTGIQPQNMVVTLTDDSPGTATATASGSVSVSKAPTTTALSVVPSTVTFGGENLAVFTATVSPVSPVGGTPTGTVTVSVGSTTLCTITLTAGTGTCSPASKALGPTPFLPDTVTGTYNGDSNFLGSSGTATLTVLPPYHPPLPPTGLVLTEGVGTAQAGPFAASLSAPQGSTAWYRLNLQNTSAATIVGVNLVDSATPGGLPASCPVLPSSLAAGATYTCTFSAPVAAGTTVNTAMATAGGAYVTASATVTASGHLGKLDISVESALGFKPLTGFTSVTPKTQATGKYVTWRFDGGMALAGHRVNILVATKVGGTWGSPRYVRSAWADANGIVTFAWTSSTTAAVNVRVQWPGGGAYGVSTSPALGAYWQ